MRRFAPRPVLTVYHSLQLHTNYPPEPWNTREHVAFSLLLFPSNHLRFPPLSLRSIVFADILTHPRHLFFRAESTPTVLHSFFLHSFSLFFCTVASHVCTLHPVHICVCLWGCCPFNVCRRTHMPCDMEHIQFKTGLCLFMCSRNIYNQNQPCFTHKSGQICTVPWKHKVAYVRWPLRSPYSVLNSVAVARHIPL